MKRIINVLSLVILMVFISHVAPAQISEKAARKAEKQEKKEAREQALAENMEVIKELVQNKNVVLDANMIRGRYQTYNNVTGPNFIKIEGDEIVVQTSNPYTYGINGLGGVTLKGRITGYEVEEKDHSISATIQFSSTLVGHTTVTLVASANGHATGYVRTNYGQRVTFIGDLTSVANSPFEGMTLF